MGFFSWKTADTDESIGNINSIMPHSQPVYLLQPDGQSAIKEEAYDGYGMFGGVDAYVWVATMNLKDKVKEIIKDASSPALAIVLNPDLSPRPIGNEMVLPDKIRGEVMELIDRLRTVAIREYVSVGLFDPNTHERIHNGVNGIPFRYDEPIERYDGKSLNELRQEKFFIEKKIDPDYPLKFSFDPYAIYEDLPASEDCEWQGFFYPELSGEILEPAFMSH